MTKKAKEFFRTQIREKVLSIADSELSPRMTVIALEELNNLLRGGRSLRVTEATQFLGEEFSELCNELRRLKSSSQKEESCLLLIEALIKQGVARETFEGLLQPAESTA